MDPTAFLALPTSEAAAFSVEYLLQTLHTATDAVTRPVVTGVPDVSTEVSFKTANQINEVLKLKSDHSLTAPLFAKVILSYVRPYISAPIVDDIAAALKIDNLVDPIQDTTRYTVYGKNKGRLAECIAAVILADLQGRKEGGGGKKVRSAKVTPAEFEGGLGWSQFFASMFAKEFLRFLQQFAEAGYFSAAVQNDEKFILAHPKAAPVLQLALPLSGVVKRRRKVKCEQLAREIQMYMSRGYGHITLSRLADRIGAWSDFCRRFDVDDYVTMKSCIQAFDDMFELNGEVVSHKERRPDHVSYATVKRKRVEDEIDDDSDDNRKPGKNARKGHHQKRRIDHLRDVRARQRKRQDKKKRHLVEMRKHNPNIGKSVHRKGRGKLPQKKKNW